MNVKRSIGCFCLFLFSVFVFYIYSGTFINAKSYQEIGIQKFLNSEINDFDYLFTVKEVSLSKITDNSITITSDNIDKNFLENARCLKNSDGYGVKYENGELTVYGLIPDFLYNSLYIEAESSKNENYILKIENFKTAKSQNLLKQFITQTLQYTLKRSIRPIEFYMWEHKILTRQVTPEEFIINVLKHPQILYDFDNRKEIMDKIYSSLFLERISEEEFKIWSDKFDEYKEKYFIRDSEAYNLIIEDMFKMEKFKNRIDALNIKQLKIPSITRYSKVYKDLKNDYEVNNKIKNIYIMDYDELNRTEVSENSAELFLSDEFDGDLNNFSKIFVDIPNAKAKYLNGKIIIENLESDTIYKNFKITYKKNGKENKIFIRRLRTKKDTEKIFLDKNVVNMKFNILNELEVTSNDFLKYFYENEYNREINEAEIDHLKLLFTMDKIRFEKFLSLLNKHDLDLEGSVLISKLYNFVFNRAPDTEGLKFWLEKFEIYKGFMSNLNEISNKIVLEMINSGEFEDRFNYVMLEKIIKFNNQERRLQFM